MARDIIPLLRCNVCKWTVRFVHLRLQLCHPRLTSTDWSNEGLWSSGGAWEWRAVIPSLLLTITCTERHQHHWTSQNSIHIIKPSHAIIQPSTLNIDIMHFLDSLICEILIVVYNPLTISIKPLFFTILSNTEHHLHKPWITIIYPHCTKSEHY